MTDEHRPEDPTDEYRQEGRDRRSRPERVADDLAVSGADAEGPAGSPERDADSGDDEPLPEPVVEEAERLTRLARRAVDDAEAAAYREDRADVLAEHDYAARVRSDSTGDVLVCLPAEWQDGDVVDPERIDDVDRAVEVPLEGADDPDDWEAVHEENHAVADAVREAHGDVHGENAAELAEYASNHFAKPIASLTAEELRRFREDYYTRNVWPDEEQADVLERSLELVYEELSVPMPEE